VFSSTLSLEGREEKTGEKRSEMKKKEETRNERSAK
jgi:hypothetical protein